MYVTERPNFHPHVCIICGVGDDRRAWYVDLQLAIDNHFNPLYNGAIYFCDVCWDDTVKSVSREVQKFTPAQQVNSQSYENPLPLVETISLEQDNGRINGDDGEPEGLPDSDAAGITDDSTVDDQPTEFSDTQFEFGDSGASESSDDAEPELANFRGFFGRSGDG